MKQFRLIPLLLFLFPNSLLAQNNSRETQLYNYAYKLEIDGKLNESISIFKNLLRSDSNNINLLQNTSILYSKIGHALPDETTGKYDWYVTADYLAKKAIVINNQSADAHYAHALAIGLLSEKAGFKTKINNAKLIKTEAELAIKLNPKLPGPYHILGRWHTIVAGFNTFERAMISALFGKMPGGSYEDAILNFQKAISLEPSNSIHYYQLALTYELRNASGDIDLAILNATKATTFPTKNDDQINTKRECEKLIAKLKKK